MSPSLHEVTSAIKSSGGGVNYPLEESGDRTKSSNIHIGDLVIIWTLLLAGWLRGFFAWP